MIFASKFDLNKLSVVLLFCSSEFRRGHPKFCLEAAVERDGVGKATGLANLLNGKLGLFIQETDGMVEAQLSDEGGEPFIAGGLGKGGSDTLL